VSFVKRVCRICGHDTYGVIACGTGAGRCDGHAERPQLHVKNDVHDHCRQGCWCTYGGCMAERVPLGSNGEPCSCPGNEDGGHSWNCKHREQEISR
jgi:hypothetical protein